MTATAKNACSTWRIESKPHHAAGAEGREELPGLGKGPEHIGAPPPTYAALRLTVQKRHGCK